MMICRMVNGGFGKGGVNRITKNGIESVTRFNHRNVFWLWSFEAGPNCEAMVFGVSLRKPVHELEAGTTKSANGNL